MRSNILIWRDFLSIERFRSKGQARYVAKFADAIYVLHCFQKKTQKTSKIELDLAQKRYRELTKEWER